MLLVLEALEDDNCCRVAGGSSGVVEPQDALLLGVIIAEAGTRGRRLQHALHAAHRQGASLEKRCY